jgi:hypothetical protein
MNMYELPHKCDGKYDININIVDIVNIVTASLALLPSN